MPHTALIERQRVGTRSGPLFLELRCALPGSGDNSVSVHAGTENEEVMADLGIDWGHTTLECASLKEAREEATLLLGQWSLREAFTGRLDVTPQVRGASPIDGGVLDAYDAQMRGWVVYQACRERGSMQLFG